MKDFPKIQSRDNRNLVDARKVRDGKDRAHIFIEGRRLVREALASDLSISSCFVAESFVDAELVDLAERRAAAIFMLPDRIFASIAATTSPQGVAVVAKRPVFSIADIEERMAGATLPVVVALKEVNDPSNLGAILRCVEAAGAAGIITTSGSADAYSVKALRSSMGSAFRLPLVSQVPLSDAMTWARERGLTIAATDIKGTQSYVEPDWSVPHLLVLGSEAHGLADEDLALVDETIKIPMDGQVESLNLAVSAGIILFEAKRNARLVSGKD